MIRKSLVLAIVLAILLVPVACAGPTNLCVAENVSALIGTTCDVGSLQIKEGHRTGSKCGKSALTGGPSG